MKNETGKKYLISGVFYSLIVLMCGFMLTVRKGYADGPLIQLLLRTALYATVILFIIMAICQFFNVTFLSSNTKKIHDIIVSFMLTQVTSAIYMCVLLLVLKIFTLL